MVVTSAGTSLADQAYKWLLDEITSSRLRVGEHLSEARITSVLGISRTPIRSALQRLEYEGLVRRTGTSRFAVAVPTVREVNEACDLLALVDAYNFKRAALRMSPEESERLVDLGRAMVAAATTPDLVLWSELDAEFHSLVHLGADNALMTATSLQIRNRIQRFWLRAARHQYRLGTCSTEHVALAEALHNKDLASIEDAVLSHVTHMRSSMLQMLQGLGDLLGDETSES